MAPSPRPVKLGDGGAVKSAGEGGWVGEFAQGGRRRAIFLREAVREVVLSASMSGVQNPVTCGRPGDWTCRHARADSRRRLTSGCGICHAPSGDG
eukprot:scaffold5143_cov119-Isochrysis_galbana.AAC.8